MLTLGVLEKDFKVYWDEMRLCRGAKAYWSLLHVATCLPDICAALETKSGETTGMNKELYVRWCDRYLPDPKLNGLERYRMRCGVLHQGRAQAGPGSRYTGFSFTGPAPNTGEIYHKQLDKTTLVVEVGSLADEVRAGVLRWIEALEADPTSDAAENVERHRSSLVKVRALPPPPTPGGILPGTGFIPRTS